MRAVYKDSKALISTRLRLYTQYRDFEVFIIYGELVALIDFSRK